MSQKYKLMQDTDDDTPSASIQRHLGVAALIVIVPIIVVVILSVFFTLAAVQKSVAREAALRDARATQVAMPTRAPRPTATTIVPEPAHRNARANSSLRRGPSLDYPTAETTRGGRPITLVGRDSSNQWFLLDEGTWIRAIDVLGSPPILPLVTTP